MRREWDRSSPVAQFQVLAHAQSNGRSDDGTTRYLFGGLEIWLRPLASAPATTLELYWAGALRLGRGEGSAGMQTLVNFADRAGVALLLYADPWGQRPRMARDALRRWYERFGFEASAEHLVAYWPCRLGLEMRRDPRCHCIMAMSNALNIG